MAAFGNGYDIPRIRWRVLASSIITILTRTVDVPDAIARTIDDSGTFRTIG